MESTCPLADVMYGGGPPVPRRDIASWIMNSAERERLMTAIGKPPIQVTGMPCAAENASVARPEEAASESALQTCVMAYPRLRLRHSACKSPTTGLSQFMTLQEPYGSIKRQCSRSCPSRHDWVNLAAKEPCGCLKLRSSLCSISSPQTMRSCSRVRAQLRSSIL